MYYREHWTAEEQVNSDGSVLLYQIICLHNTPPLDADEQARCMKPRTTCWRDPSIKCSKAAAEAYAAASQPAAASHQPAAARQAAANG